MSNPEAPSHDQLSAGLLPRRGLLLVLSSPSGAGKTTLAKRLLDGDPTLGVSVSVTTRAPRPGEQDGRDYHFVSPEEFKRQEAAGELLEWAQVHGNFYASPRAPVERAIAAGQDMLFDIDWQGARQIREKLGADMVSVFILPPTGKALERRLKARGQDSAEVVARRVAAAASEIVHWCEYDYVIVNGDIDASFATLSGILAAERHRRTRQTGLGTFVDDLLVDI